MTFPNAGDYFELKEENKMTNHMRALYLPH